jgi:hypothetical protein
MGLQNDLSGKKIGTDLNVGVSTSVIFLQLRNSTFSGLLRRVVRWLETNVSEALLPSSSGLKFVILEDGGNTILRNACFQPLDHTA